jgi:hypothetical protein
LSPKRVKVAGFGLAYAASMKRSTQSRRGGGPTERTPVDRGDLRTALEVAKLLWPEFHQERGATFIAFRRPIAHRPFESFPGDLVGAELFVNRVQVLRFGFRHSAMLMRVPFWRRTHPDFARACRLAELVGEAWAAKLGREFPDKDFAILVTRDADPSVNFHEIRTPKDVFYSVEKNPPGTLLVIRSKSGRRAGSIRPPVAGERPPRLSPGMVGAFTLAMSPVRSSPGAGKRRQRRRRGNH